MTEAYVPQPPASLDEANVKLDRYARLVDLVAVNEATREKQHADTNAVADAIALPWLKELRELKADLEPWWPTVAAELTRGKRKTIELGGCKIGSKAGTTKVVHTHDDDDAAVEALMGVPWARKTLVKTSYSLDRPAIKAALAGTAAKVGQLKTLGFSAPEPAETFVLERLKTSGTVTG